MGSEKKAIKKYIRKKSFMEAKNKLKPTLDA